MGSRQLIIWLEKLLQIWIINDIILLEDYNYKWHIRESKIRFSDFCIQFCLQAINVSSWRAHVIKVKTLANYFKDPSGIWTYFFTKLSHGNICQSAILLWKGESSYFTCKETILQFILKELTRDNRKQKEHYQKLLFSSSAQQSFVLQLLLSQFYQLDFQQTFLYKTLQFRLSGQKRTNFITMALAIVRNQMKHCHGIKLCTLQV